VLGNVPAHVRDKLVAVEWGIFVDRLTSKERVSLGQRLKLLADVDRQRIENPSDGLEGGTDGFQRSSDWRLLNALGDTVREHLMGFAFVVGAAEYEERAEVGVFTQHHRAFFGAGEATNVDRSKAARKGNSFPLDEPSGENGVDDRAAAAAGKVKDVAFDLAHNA
jgi:hypothetical protein